MVGQYKERVGLWKSADRFLNIVGLNLTFCRVYLYFFDVVEGALTLYFASRSFFDVCTNGTNDVLDCGRVQIVF